MDVDMVPRMKPDERQTPLADEMPSVKEPSDGIPSKRISFTIEFRHPLTGDVISKQPVDSFDKATRTMGEELPIEGDDSPIFEIVASYAARSNTNSSGLSRASRKGPPGWGPPGAYNAPTITQPTALSRPTYYMNIYSPAIINALRSVVKYYPRQDLSGDPIVVTWPYPVLVHHYTQLAEYRDVCKAKSLDERCVRDQDSEDHINTILEYLDEHIMPGVHKERERNERGFFTWEHIWVNYKPGSVVVVQTSDGMWNANVIKSIHGGTFANPPRPWDINHWSLDYDGEVVSRHQGGLESAAFDGERELKGNELYIHNHDLSEEDIRGLSQETADKYDNGKKFWALLHKQCRWYKGRTGTFPFNEIDGLVMSDLEAYYTEVRTAKTTFMERDDLRDWTSDCACQACEHNRKAVEGVPEKQVQPLFEDYIDIRLETCEELDPMGYLLLPSQMTAFVFATRSWELLHVDKFAEPKFAEDMIDSLVMDPSRKKTLKALSASFIRQNRLGEILSRDMWSADFVKGKGGGLVFLLHGKPGMGKTCTAECIAAFTKRPLMTLTSSDIGTDPAQVESNLSRSFKTAKSWGAILLIDEADIFMENRSSRDLVRNGLVAGFLRALEYYDGILFLTTNRVGTFDDAFISRVHVQVYYPDFTDIQRQEVWTTFIDRLARERGDYMRLTIDAKDYLRSKGVKAMKWNGREIRNTFQTAVALAEYDSDKGEDGLIRVTDEHFRPVVELSKDFKAYLDTLHKANEAKRAQVKKERLDSYEGGEEDN